MLAPEMTRLAPILFLLALHCFAAAIGCAPLYRSIATSTQGFEDPALMMDGLSRGARRLVEQAFEGIRGSELGDMHVHLLTRDMHPRWLNPWRLVQHGRTQVYLMASDVQSMETIEKEFVDRLVDLIRHQPVVNPGRFYIYAMDHFYREDGTIDREQSWFAVSNEHVWKVAQWHPDLFVPVASIHPHRADAIDELRRWAANGVRHIKWLPNSQGFDPADARHDDFYIAMAELDRVLMSHTGDEDAIEAVDDELGNPLRLRRPLNHGVKVIALRGAIGGSFRDLDLLCPNDGATA